MNRYAEERAAAIQSALDIKGFPKQSDLPRLVQWLGDCITVGVEPDIPRGTYERDDDGRGHITLPESLDDDDLEHATIHELAHYLCKHGASALFWSSHLLTPSERTRKLAQAWSLKEEAEVMDFLWAWLLPSWLLSGSVDRISERSRQNSVAVRRRLEMLNGWVLRNPFPPQWCAYWDFSLYVRRSSLVSVADITARRGGGKSFFVPLEGKDVEESIRPLKADLLALTTEEFSLKYDCLKATGEVWPIEPSEALMAAA